jgi:integrase
MARQQAQAVAGHIEALVAARLAGVALPNATASWLADLGPALRLRLADLGVIDLPGQSPALGPFLADYLERRKADLQPSTLAIIRQAASLLVRYFGEDRRLDAIGPAEALDWERWLMTQARTRNRTGGLSLATVRKRVRVAKTIFNEAVEREILARNPFAKLKGSAPASSRREFISAETIAKAIDYCPDAQWRLILALARWGGLRIPSELLALTWDCVDWERQRLRIPSPKTARAGKPYRIIPLFPEIRPYLEEVFEQAKPGTAWIITRYRTSNVNLRTQFLRILAKAGIEPWPQLFQSLRKTRATELARTFPRHVATAWLGHTEAVAERNYWTVTDADFEKALASPSLPRQHRPDSLGGESQRPDSSQGFAN